MAFDVTNRSTYRATEAEADRKAEANQNIPTEAWDNGVNNASCSAGLGVGYENPDLYNNPSYGDGLLDGDPGQFTLLDQDEAVRVPQVSQEIGGLGAVSRTGDQIYTWDASQPLYTSSGAASSGGVEGKGTEFLAAVSNPDNIIVDGESVPDNNAGPTTNGTGNLQTTAAGWVAL
jgi:hypothetical protein